jgi:GNAT superfamily N-acetyltransferase
MMRTNKKIKVTPLTKNPEWLPTVIKWSQEESGGLMAADANEIEFIRAHQQCFYVIEYGADIFKQPVGMFALFDYPIDETLQEKLGDRRMNGVRDLDYFYIIDAMRGQGIGGAVMQKIKEIAKKSGAELIVFDTITPHLNRFYERNGAKIVCDNWFRDMKQNRVLASTYFQMIV